jgi:aminoglycoside 6-adenylyltransferase
MMAIKSPDPADDTRRRLVQWGQERPDVRAMLLTSSRAIPNAPVDVFSDYDVIVVAEDIHPFLEDRSWLASFGKVLTLYRDPLHRELGHERFRCITQYEDGQKIDFTVWAVDLLRVVARQRRLPDELDVGYLVLLDKDRLTRELPPATGRAHIPTCPTAEQYRDLIEEFFHEATYVAKQLWRRELLPAKYSLDHVMKHELLRRMLEWRVEIDHKWSVKAGDLGRGLQTRLAPDTWIELERTYVGPEIAQNWEALFGTLALFRRLAAEVGHDLGYVYPRDLDERVVAYLGRVQTLDPRAKEF